MTINPPMTALGRRHIKSSKRRQTAPAFVAADVRARRGAGAALTKSRSERAARASRTMLYPLIKITIRPGALQGANRNRSAGLSRARPAIKGQADGYGRPYARRTLDR